MIDNINQTSPTRFDTKVNSEYYSSPNQKLKRMKPETIVKSNEYIKRISNHVDVNLENSSAENDFMRVLLQPQSPLEELPILKCEKCNDFECKYWDNFIFHQSECILREISEEEEKDMGRRQRIRGEDSDLTNIVSHTDDCENKSALEPTKDIEMDIEDDSSTEAEENENFPYMKKDVVWVELKRLFWPAIVLDTYPGLGKKGKVKIDIVCRPEIKGITQYLTIDSDKVIPFDKSAKKQAYIDAGSSHLLHKINFDKALTRANRFANKNSLNEESDLKESEEVSNSSYNSKVDDDTILEELNLVEDIINCVKNGDVNNHLVGILDETIKSERHAKFYSNNSSEKAELAERPWFGPINDLNEQTSFYEYVFSLFQKKSKKVDVTGEDLCYVYQVWCPEAIIQAISLIEDINDAEKAEGRFMELTRNATHYSGISG